MACTYSQEDMGGHDAIVCFVDRKPTFTELENLKTPYLRRAGVSQCWERSPSTNVKQKSGFIKRVDKGLMTTVKDLESWCLDRQPFVRANDEGLTLETSAF